MRTPDSAPRAPASAETGLLAELVVGLAALEGMQVTARDSPIGSLLHALRRRFLQLFRQECDRLDLDRSVAGRLDLRIEPVDVRRTCEALVASIRPLTERSRISIEVEPAGGDAVLRLDRERLEQVLVTLFAEALRAESSGGRISLRVSAQAGSVALTLSAPGGAPADGTPALSLAAALLRCMGGELRGPRTLTLRDAPGDSARERIEAGGAMAEWIAEWRRSPEVRLALVDAATDRQATLAGHGLVESVRVLLISDDPFLSRLVPLLVDERNFLATAGVAAGGAMVETLSPQVILCDRVETVERLRAGRRPAVPILLLAGPSERGPSAADAVLRRPFSAADLRGALRKLSHAHVPARPVEEDRLAALTLVASGVAHEVLNPLWFSTLALFDLEKVLGREDVGTGARAEGVALIESMRIGLDRVSSVMADLRAYALREAASQPVSTDLHEGIRRTLRLLLLRRPEGVRVHTELCADGRVVCRAGRMNQVFFNLALNALQAVGDEGDVWIRSWAEGDRLHVSVRDNGPGIPAEHLGSLFRPFFTTKDPGRSSGLGLASSRRIVKEHGGDIHVRSEPGQGSEFVAILPRRPAAAPASE